MKVLTLADIIEALSGIRPPHADLVVSEAVIHSQRTIPASLFVAIPGERSDGHNFVADAFQRGASLALIQHDMSAIFPTFDLRQGFNSQCWAGINLERPLCLLVENTLQALQKIAHFWRRNFTVRVVGITGSIGKSTTKEVIAEVLQQRYRTLKNIGNYNNEIGLPLTLLRLSEGYECVVLEMGFYVPGEISFLCDLALPHIGVITNIGTVHAERAGSQEVIAQGKAELVQALPPDGVAILNYDDPWVRWMADRTKARVVYYGLDPKADFWADQIEGLGLEGIRFQIHHQKDVIPLRLPMIGRHAVQTALRAAAVGISAGLDWQEIINGLRHTPAQLRLVTVRTESGALILDDSYNSTPESALAALNLLNEINGYKIAVLGDMLELGMYEQQGHEKVGIRAAEIVDELITVGRRAHIIAQTASQNGLARERIKEFEDSQQVIEFLRNRLSENNVLLVKGSRAMRMEKIITALEGC